MAVIDFCQEEPEGKDDCIIDITYTNPTKSYHIGGKDLGDVRISKYWDLKLTNRTNIHQVNMQSKPQQYYRREARVTFKTLEGSNIELDYYKDDGDNLQDRYCLVPDWEKAKANGITDKNQMKWKVQACMNVDIYEGDSQNHGNFNTDE